MRGKSDASKPTIFFRRSMFASSSPISRNRALDAACWIPSAMFPPYFAVPDVTRDWAIRNGYRMNGRAHGQRERFAASAISSRPPGIANSRICSRGTHNRARVRREFGDTGEVSQADEGRPHLHQDARWRGQLWGQPSPRVIKPRGDTRLCERYSIPADQPHTPNQVLKK